MREDFVGLVIPESVPSAVPAEREKRLPAGRVSRSSLQGSGEVVYSTLTTSLELWKNRDRSMGDDWVCGMVSGLQQAFE